MFRARSKRFLTLTVKLALLAFLLVVLISFFVAQPFVVSGISMQPTFYAGDYLVIDRLSYDFQKPQRGDLIVFHYPLDPSQFFIKRIVALPGETVEENTGALVATTSSQQERAASASEDATTSAIITLASDEYFVLGDNRSESADSREWGPLQRKFIVGRVLFRAWPLAL